jgi:hypothetical protein
VFAPTNGDGTGRTYEMTVQTTVFDGNKRTTRTYRNIYKGVNLAQLREGFLAQEDWNKWGTMIQLKGKERILLARFGEGQELDD